MSNEKPERVEVGQRYRTYADVDGEVVAISDGMATLKWTDGDNCSWETAWACAEVLSTKNLRYLGPSPGKESPGMEEDEGGAPARCLKCGGDKNGNWWICRRCSRPWPGELTQEWEAGARDFPRQPALPAPAVPASGPIKAYGQLNCAHGKAHHCAECDIARAKARQALDRLRSKTLTAVTGRLIGETRASDGTPLSALQSIPCVRSSEDLKKSPPWVPSIDEDHWIPEVGERGRR